MYDEMGYLFDVSPKIKNQNNISEGNKITSTKNPLESFDFRSENGNVNKYIINKDGVDNWIRSVVNDPYKSNENPYITLIKKFNGENGAESLKLTSTDFAYLRDIGVFPINRLMILRRFAEGAVVTSDLSTLGKKPIAVVVGWVKKDDPLLSFSFNEVWQQHTTPLHELLAQIIQDSFGIDITSILPVPGWGIGFMFGIMNKMGLTEDYTSKNIPIGDPDLLKESITRPHESFGLQTDFTFELNTTYEQKYIAGIDPGVAHFDILSNLLTMGTSNVNVIGKKGSGIISNLNAANNDPTNMEAWLKVVDSFVKGLTTALDDAITKAGDSLKALNESGKSTTPITTKKLNKKEAAAAAAAEEQQRADNAKTGADKMADKQNKLNDFSKLLGTDLMKSILASTVARYQWPLRGSISMFTGDANTPWHLTIGNPYSPLLSMNNIYVSNVAITYGKDMAQNDIPRTMDVKISMKQGRSLGKQEIYSFFGVSYKREYNKAINSASTTTEAEPATGKKSP